MYFCWFLTSSYDLFLLCWFPKAFDMVLGDQLWERLQQFGYHFITSCESHVNQSAQVRSMVTYMKSCLTLDVPCSYTIWHVHWRTMLPWVLWLFSAVVAGLLCAENCVLLSKSEISTQQAIWVFHFQLMSIYLIPESWSLAETKGNWSKWHIMQVRIKLR